MIAEVRMYPGDEVFAALVELRSEFQQTGLYPVILGDPIVLDELQRQLPSQDEVEQTIRRSRAIGVPGWFVDQAELEPDQYGAQDGEWPARLEEYDLIASIEEDFAREPDRALMIGLFRASAGWEVFAHLGWGGWNDCPGAQEHCAVHRYWEETYGAEAAVIMEGRIDCMVRRPPMSEATSMELARQQYAYSPDIVNQGCTYLSMLAATILKSDHWYFWWD